MKFVNIRSTASKDELLGAISDNNFVNSNVDFQSGNKTPFMHVKEKNGRIRIKCEIMNGPTKDNGFIVGTFFVGKIKDCSGGSKLSGIILTAPIYHLIVFGFIAFVIYQCIVQKGINVIPLFVLVFDYMLFRNEFKKQGYIQRYLYRANARLEKKKR